MAQENCLICGQKLDYLDKSKRFTCISCGKEELGSVCCSQGHYVCDHCHGARSFDNILKMIIDAEGSNPVLIAEKIINEASIPMLGCEHAWVAAGALMAAIRNHGEIVITEEDLMEVLHRTKRQAIGAYCGLTGVCGIAPAIGAVYSVILKAACPKNEETAATMYVVARVIEAISKEAGPCCCKSFVYTGLKVAAEYADHYLKVKLDTENSITCRHSAMHPHGCRKEKCLYYSLA